MVRTVTALLLTYRVALYELAGGALLVAGTAVIGGDGPALVAGGVCLLAKSVEHDLKRAPKAPER